MTGPCGWWRSLSTDTPPPVPRIGRTTLAAVQRHPVIGRRNTSMAENRERCCSTCKWHCHEDITDGWVCVNSDSEYCTDFTPYDHSCPDWEERSQKA